MSSIACLGSVAASEVVINSSRNDWLAAFRAAFLKNAVTSFFKLSSLYANPKLEENMPLSFRTPLAAALSTLILGLSASACSVEPVELSACERAVADRLTLNAFDLFEASNVCAEEERKFETNLLLLTGQARATTDMTVFRPLGDENSARVTELYGQIYTQYGGIGFNDLYVSETQTNALFEALRISPIALTEDYDPGWSYKSDVRDDLYDALARDQIEHRLWTIDYMATLLRIPAYYDAHEALNHIHKEQGVIDVSSPIMEEVNRLNVVMAEIAQGVQRMPPPQPSVSPRDFLAQPGAEDSFHQVASGLNGPEMARYDLFKSKADVRTSWVSSVLTDGALNDILGNIDFETETLGAYALGKRQNLSGTIYVTDFDFNETLKSYRISISLGLIPDACEMSGIEGNPFVLAVTSGGGIEGGKGRGFSTFPDKCPRG